MAQDPLKSFVSASAPGAESLPKVNTIFDLSAEGLGQLRTWLEQNPPSIPVTQILGFSQFTANSAFVPTLNTTISSSFADMATPGPEIDGLSGGQYLLLFGFTGKNSASGSDSIAGISVNGASPTTDAQVLTESTVFTSVMTATAVSLPNGNNTLKMVFEASPTTTATFERRFLIALRYANL